MYDDIAPSYNALHGAEQRGKLDSILHFVDLKPGMAVADIGCGTAHLAPYFAQQSYIGIDPSRPLLEQAPDGVKVICAKGEDIPLPDASQDLVLSLTALHNYDDWGKGIKELARIARNLLIVGVLKKAPQHDAIVQALKARFTTVKTLDDPHDTLLLLRNN